MNARNVSLPVRLASLVASLGRTWSLGLTFSIEPRHAYPTLRPRRGPAPHQSTNTDILNAYAGTERDPLKLSAQDRAAILRDVVARLAGRVGLNDGALKLAIGGAWKRLHVARLTTGRSFPAPSAAWTERKRRLGLSTIHMRASGQLLRAVTNAHVTIH